MDGKKKKSVFIVGALVFLVIIILLFLFMFKDKKYKVEFSGANVTALEVNKNGTITKPQDPVKEGYKFVGWYTEDGKEFDFNTKVTSDIKLEAKWEKVELLPEKTVTFRNEDGSILSIEKTLGDGTIQKPADPVKEEYDFVGWYNGDTLFDFSIPVTSDVQLIPKFEKKDANNKTYKVSFNSDGGSTVANQTIEENKTATKPANPTKKGYRFVSWQLDGVNYNFSTPITKDITLKATWEKHVTYTVTFNSDGGSKVNAQTIEENKTATKPANPTKTGYNFVSWQLDGKDYNFATKVTKNITLKARWKQKTKYTVTFDSNGGSAVSSKTVYSGDAIGTLPTPTRGGYTFGGWYSGNTRYDAKTKINGNITLKASWTEIKRTVTFDYENGTKKTVVVLDGSKVGKPQNPVKEGYVFNFWQINNKEYDFNSKVMSDIIIKAKYSVLNVNYSIINELPAEFACAAVLERISDGTDYCYFSCPKSSYFSIKFSDGRILKLNEALSQDLVKIRELQGLGLPCY